MKPILLVGGGGHACACIDVIEASGLFMVRGIVERDSAETSAVLNYPVLGSDSDLPRLLEETPSALVTVGQVKSSNIRASLHGLLVDLGAELPVIASPMSYVSGHSTVGDGSIIMHGTIINAAAEIGRNCIINSQALIEHEVVIGDHCHVSTGAKVNGGVHVGAGTFIGSGAVVREGVHIGTNCVVGAGTVVLKDLPDRTSYLGRP